MKPILTLILPCILCLQEFIEEPSETVINPGDDFLLVCLIRNKAGECRWEKDGTPVGMFEGKYEWAGNVLSGDCSIHVTDASKEYDNGSWLCQVTASDFTQKDALISKQIIVQVRGNQELVLFQSYYLHFSGSNEYYIEEDA